MIKLNLPREPHWITLAAGLRLQVRPATTALVMAARHAASKVAGTDTAAAGERTATLITELAKLAVLAWEGVADDKMVRPFFRDILGMAKACTKPYGHIYACCDWHSAFVIEAISR